jgi:hypothetical protein
VLIGGPYPRGRVGLVASDRSQADPHQRSQALDDSGSGVHFLSDQVPSCVVFNVLSLIICNLPPNFAWDAGNQGARWNVRTTWY